MLLRDNSARGKAFDLFRIREDGLKAEDGWVFDKKLPGTTATGRPDAHNPKLGKSREHKSGSDLNGRDLAQLADIIVAVDQTGFQHELFFGSRPTARARKATEQANRKTAVNRQRIANGQEPLPMIVAHYTPALAQPVPRGGSGGANAPNAPNRPNGPDGAGGGAQGTLSTGEQPVTGALTDSIATSPDSPADAAEMTKVDAALAEDFGADAIPEVSCSAAPRSNC